MNQSPSLDTWTALFLVVAGFGFFLSLLIFRTKTQNQVCRNSLGGIITAFSTLLILYVGFWTKYMIYFHYPFKFWICCVYLVAPLFFIYVYYAQRKLSFRKIDLFHFVIPVLLFVFLMLQTTTNWISPTSEVVMEQSNLLYYPLTLLSKLTLPVVMLFTLMVYLTISLIDVIKNQSRITHQSKKLTPWLKTLLWLYAGYIASLTSYYILIRQPWFKVEWDYAVSFSMSIFIYAIGILGYTRPEILNGKIFDQQPFSKKYKSSTLTETAARILAVKLDQKMSEHELFLKSDLKIKSLADELNCTVHELSQIINERKGLHFNDYVNKFRIQRAVEMILDPELDGEPLKTIAYSVGFNNPTSFYKAFKKIQGISPSDYRNQSKDRKTSAESA